MEKCECCGKYFDKLIVFYYSDSIKPHKICEDCEIKRNMKNMGVYMNVSIEFIIGNYSITKFDDNSIWITDTKTGEGGQFSAEMFYEMVHKFYKENF